METGIQNGVDLPFGKFSDARDGMLPVPPEEGLH